MSSKRAVSLVAYLFVALTAAAGCKQAQVKVSEKAVETKVDEQALIRFVEESQRACFVENDVDKYMAMWTEDARLVGGRGPEPGPHDLTLTRAQIEATKRLRYGDKTDSPSFDLAFKNPRVRVDGDTVELGWRAVFSGKGWEEVTEEIYKLRETPQGWRAFENRYWIIRQADRTQDAAFWARQDAQVVAAKEGGDGFVEAQALMSAHRMTDAFERLKSLSKDQQNAQTWALRAAVAVIVGDIDDARQSACHARAIDPEAGLPTWATKLACPR